VPFMEAGSSHPLGPASRLWPEVALVGVEGIGLGVWGGCRGRDYVVAGCLRYEVERGGCVVVRRAAPALDA
jgi:hypothetical protein